MLKFEVTRIATAALGALVLSTSFVAAAVAPATSVSTDAGGTAYARAHDGNRANG